MYIPYYRNHGEYGFFKLRPLNPTGRWKLVTNDYYKNRLFIEHKGLLFKYWVAEKDIEFHLKREEYIFDCNNR